MEWDLFHRVDLGTTKAIAASSAALEVFDVARVLGQLFGVGDGRVIFRAAAAAIGAKHLRVPDQSGTRKVVALARTVERLLQSLKTYQAGLHARRGQAEGPGRRGAQSKMHLVNVGRRVTALNFVTFLVALSDVLRTRVVPLAMRSQAVSGASWEMDSTCQRTLRQLDADLQVLRVLRRWVFISALLQQYLSDVELRRFWFALVSHFRKPFPPWPQPPTYCCTGRSMAVASLALCATGTRLSSITSRRSASALPCIPVQVAALAWCCSSSARGLFVVQCGWVILCMTRPNGNKRAS